MRKLLIVLIFLSSIGLKAESVQDLKSIYCNKISSIELIALAKIKGIYLQIKQVSEQLKPVLEQMPEPQKKQTLEKLKQQDALNNLNLLCVALDTDCDFDKIDSLDEYVGQVERIQSMAEAYVKSAAGSVINQTVDCISTQPGNPVLNFNFALALSFSDDNKKSIEVFNSILKKLETDKSNMTKEEHLEIKFYTLFNLGVLQSQENQIDEALSYYQMALEIQPESKEIKTNIELLFQKQQQQGQQSQDGQKGDNKDKGNNKEQQDEKEEQKDKNPENNKNQDKQNQDKQDFKSKKLSKDDVRKILEELKNQENKIRMNEYQKGKKGQESNDGKNW